MGLRMKADGRSVKDENRVQGSELSRKIRPYFPPEP
jgi:hypothetical protein